MQAKGLFSAVILALVVAVALGAAGGAGQGAERLKAPANRVAEPARYENLSVFPVVAAWTADTGDFLTLDEALASGEAVVAELGGEILRRSREPQGRRGRPRPVPLPAPQGGAQVNRLVLVNRSTKPLVLLAGEVVTGGKQDRVVAKDRIVAPGAEPLPLDVFCVERGRWAGAGQFAAAKMMAHPSVREKAAVEQKQDEVWAAVRSGTTARSDPGAAEAALQPPPPPVLSRETVAGAVAEADTESYARIYKGARIGGSVEAFAAEIERRFDEAAAKIENGRVVGVVVAYGGELAWADVFASAELFERYWPKLARSYAVEALARPRSTERASVAAAQKFLAPLEGRETTESEPGVYRWRQVVEKRYAEITLEALDPAMRLHWVKIQRTG